MKEKIELLKSLLLNPQVPEIEKVVYMKTLEKLGESVGYKEAKIIQMTPKQTDGKPQIGDVLWFRGYGRDGDRYIVVEHLELDRYRSEDLRLVDEKESKFQVTNSKFLKDWNNPRGIGFYYPPKPDSVTMEYVEELKQKATEKKLATQKAKDEAERLSKEKKAKAKQLIEKIMPKDAKAIIVASFNEDTSDPYSDYHGHSTKRQVLLGFSTHTRDLFSELRKIAALSDIPEIRSLETAPKEYEHREKYSMGEGYYLGKSKYSGWNVQKNSYGNFADEDFAEPENVSSYLIKGIEQATNQSTNQKQLATALRLKLAKIKIEMELTTEN